MALSKNDCSGEIGLDQKAEYDAIQKSLATCIDRTQTLI